MQTIEEFGDFGCLAVKSARLSHRYVIQIACNVDLRLQFSQRTTRMTQEIPEIFRRESRLSFSLQLDRVPI